MHQTAASTSVFTDSSLPGILAMVAIAAVVLTAVLAVLVVFYRQRNRQQLMASVHTTDKPALAAPVATTLTQEIVELEPEAFPGLNQLQLAIKALRTRISDLRSEATERYTQLHSTAKLHADSLLLPIQGNGTAARNLISKAEQVMLRAQTHATASTPDVASGAEATLHASELLDRAEALLYDINAHCQELESKLVELTNDASETLRRQCLHTSRPLAAMDESAFRQHQAVVDAVAQIHLTAENDIGDSRANHRTITMSLLAGFRLLDTVFVAIDDTKLLRDHRLNWANVLTSLAEFEYDNLYRYVTAHGSDILQTARRQFDHVSLLLAALNTSDSDCSVDTATTALQRSTEALRLVDGARGTARSNFGDATTARQARITSNTQADAIRLGHDDSVIALAWGDFDSTTNW